MDVVRRRAAFAALVLVVALAGCRSGQQSSTTSASPSPSSDPAGTSATEAATTAAGDDATGSVAASTVTQPSLADPPPAALAVAQDDVSYLVLTVEAKTLFAAWVDYELFLPTYSRGAESDLEAGITVCVWRHKGHLATSIVNLLSSELGYNGAAAAGITRAAQESLCPSLNLGYQTIFDRMVSQFQTDLVNRVTFARMVAFYEYGYFLKTTCNAIANPSVGGRGLIDFVTQQINAGALSLAGPGTDQVVILILLAHAVLAGCIGYYDDLPPLVQNAP